MTISKSIAVLPAVGVIVAILITIGTLASGSTRVRAQGVPACGPMDVAFVVDDTGSMGGALANVNSQLSGIVSSINTASGGAYRLSLTTFKDNITVRQVFAPGNGAAVQADLGTLVASGGSGEPEASDEALNTVVNALPVGTRPQNIAFSPPFNPASLKIAILVTDARPGGFDDSFTPGDVTNAHNVALSAASQGIKISAVLINGGGFTAVATPIMQDYATTTGGLFTLAASDGSGTGAAIQKIIDACGSGDGPDLTVTKTLKPGLPRPVAGGLTSFIIRVKNNGNRPTPPPPTDVMMRDDLSGVGTFVFWIANSGKCTGWAGYPYVDCSRGQMAPGEEWVIEITVRLNSTFNACTGLVNRVIVDRWNLIKETNESNNTASYAAIPPDPTCEE